MTTLIVNDTDPIEMETSGDESVFDILVAAQENWEPNQTINALEVNGQAVEPLEEATLMAIPAHEASVKITLVTAKPRSTQETIDEANSYMDRLIKGFEEVAGQIRSKNNSEAHAAMHDGLEGMSNLVELLEHFRNREKVPQDLRAQYTDYLQELQEKSQEMTDAQESGDPTLIADILEYELVDAVTELKEYLAQLTPHIV